MSIQNLNSRVVIVLICVISLFVVAPRAGGQNVETLPVHSSDFRETVQEAKQLVFPAVVYIRCIREGMESGKKLSQEISGSGVIISADGEALTNWHVVDKATSVRCQLSDGRAMRAKVIGSDKSVDLALVKLLPDSQDDVEFPYAKFGDSTVLEEGDFVMAMGAPFGLNRSVSIGIISCVRRYLPDTSEYSLWMQTDAAINPGNSGGPLVNTDGAIVGINTRGMSRGNGLGFTVPAATIQELLPMIRSYGAVQWNWTGLQLQPLRDFDRDMYFGGEAGVIIADTEPESPARQAGLMPRDRILRVNELPLNAITIEDLPDVRRFLGLLPINEAANIEIVRNGERHTFEVTPRGKGKVEGEERAYPRWDFTLKAINQFDNEDLFFYRTEGVFVYGIKYPGNAGRAGLQENDIIVQIDGKEVTTLDDVASIHGPAIEDVEDKHKVLMTVLRNGLMRQFVLDYARDYEKD